jgi:transcriptional regulator with XRE-family HTH domain
MQEQKIISQNITKLRSKLGWNQSDIANYLGVTREAISNYERGERSVPYDLLEKLATFYCVEIADLLEENLDSQTANLAFAFRANDLNADDLQQIAFFKKIVTNYQKMTQLASKNGI